MLSAVAARKARLAQTQGQAPAETPVSPATPASAPSKPKCQKTTPAKPSSASQKPPSKRKPSAPAGNPPKRKKTQERIPAPAAKGRYFAQDAFSAQDDVIVVDESDGESSAASSSAASDSEDVPRTMRASGGKRAWSPSVPLADSSDEDGEEADEQVILDVQTPARSTLAQDAPQVLSTFQPILDQNVFRLPATDHSPRKRTVLLPKQSETVALLGAYTVAILRGNILLAGVPLTPSSTAHPVFAPRSSPLPIIQCLPQRSSGPNTPTALDLPASVCAAASEADAVVVLQELYTGIEGLGRICRTFDGFFAPSRWHRNQLRFDLGLDNVYFVRFPNKYSLFTLSKPFFARAAALPDARHPPAPHSSNMGRCDRYSATLRR